MVKIEISGSPDEVVDALKLFQISGSPDEVDTVTDDSPADTGDETADVVNAAGLFDRLRPLHRLKQRAIDGAVERGADRAEAEAAVREIGDGKFLDWLMNGGLEKIIELILKVLMML